MKIVTDHIIYKLIIKASFSSPSMSLDIPKRLHELSQQVVPVVIDNICADYDLVYRNVILDRVSIDLGPINIEELSDSFPKNLTQALQEAFTKQLGHPTGRASNTTAAMARQSQPSQLVSGDTPAMANNQQKSQGTLAIIQYFLQTGMLPARATHPIRIQTLIDELLTDHMILFTQLIQQLVRQKKPRKRLAYHISQPQLAQLISYRLGPDMGNIVEILLSGPSKLSLGSSHAPDRIAIIEALLMQLFATNTSSEEPSVVLWKTLEALARQWKLKVKEILWAVQEAVTPTELDKLVRELNLDEQKTSPLQFPAEDNSLTESSIPAHAGDGHHREGTAEDVGHVETPNTLPESMLVQNVGILLIWPFLEGFFEMLKLTVDGRFQDENARVKAIYMLHYLATVHDEAEEYELVIYKLLCGMPVDEPVPIETTLTNHEKEFSDGLIMAMIKNWPAVGDTNIGSIRETYFKRTGRASEKANGWMLEIEGETWDILLDSLPWGFGLVHLPWMEQVIHVAWKPQ